MSVEFGLPNALMLLALAALPLLLARRRPPRERRAVANLYLWRDVDAASDARMVRRRRPASLSMLLQMLAIALTALALARPALIVPASRVTLVLDQSASMAARDAGGAERIAVARTRARELVSQLPAASHVRVIAAAATPRVLGEYAAASPSLGRVLDGITPTAGDADLRAAVAVARAIDESSVVAVFSDRPPLEERHEASREVRWHRVGRAADNVAISLVSASRTDLGADGGRVLVEARNFSGRPVDAPIELATDDRAFTRRTVSVPAGGSAAIAVAAAHLGRIVSARLLDSDALAVDDVRYARVPASERLRVALVGRRNSFLERALSANPLISLEVVDQAATASAALVTADVVVCDGCPAPPPAARSTLLVRPPDGAAVPGPLTIADPEHPVAAALELVGETAVTSAGGDIGHVVLRAGDRPAVVAVDDDQHRVLEWQIDLRRGGFPLSPVFPVLMANAVQWLSGSDEEHIDVGAGEPLHVAFPAAERSGRPMVTGPDGRVRAAISHGRVVVVADTSVAGPYRIRVGNLERIAVVNASVDSESDLRNGPSTSTPRAATTAAARLTATNEPLSLTPLCGLLAVSAMALEWTRGPQRLA